MEHVVKMFGGAALCMIVVVMAWSLVYHVQDDAGNEGVLQMIGAQVGGWGSVIAGEAFDNLKSESAKEYPVINCLQTQSLAPGVYQLGALVGANDYAGNPLGISVKIRQPGMVDWDEYTGEDTVSFEQRGIYTLKVETKDAYGRRSVSQIEFPVN